MDFRENDFSLRGVKVVDKVKENIHTEYSNPDLTIDDLVKQTGMTKNHVRKIFNDLCGETISQYLSNYRFEKAKELLIQTDYPAVKISEMVGIANSNYFYVLVQEVRRQVSAALPNGASVELMVYRNKAAYLTSELWGRQPCFTLTHRNRLIG